VSATHQKATFVALHPNDADLSAASVRRFLKLAEASGLATRVRTTRATLPPELYLSKSKTHNVGDVKTPERQVDCVFITITDFVGFAAHAVWYDGKFDFGTVGGQSTGHRPRAMYTQITKFIEEVNRCLSPEPTSSNS